MNRWADEGPHAGAEPDEEELDRELEQTELARRLRELEWPAAPQEVKERGLQEIMKRVGRE